MRRAFLLAPLLVAGSVWPAAGAGSVTTHPVPVVIDTGLCSPDSMLVGETCGLWMAPGDPASSTFGYANLRLWGVASDADCTNASSAERSDWLEFGYPNLRTLSGDPAGSAPTYVCADTGHSSRDWSELAAQEGTVKQFPVNDCDGQLDADGEPGPCPATPGKYDIVMFARMRILHVYRGNDPVAIGTFGPPPAPGACGLRGPDPNAICLVLEMRGEAVRPDMQVAHSHAGPFVGEDTYDASSAGQVIDEVVPRGGRTFVAFRIENDGDTDDTLVVEAAGDRAGLVARFRSLGRNVTTAVTGRGWKVRVPADSFRLLQLRIHAPVDSGPRLVRRWTVRARSRSEPGLADAARAAIRVRA
jgi:hypothetical protein